MPLRYGQREVSVTAWKLPHFYQSYLVIAKSAGDAMGQRLPGIQVSGPAPCVAMGPASPFDILSDVSEEHTTQKGWDWSSRLDFHPTFKAAFKQSNVPSDSA